MVVMEMLKYTCVPNFTFMHCIVCKRSEEVLIAKSARGHFLLTVVMETMKCTCAPRMYTIVGKFEK